MKLKIYFLYRTCCILLAVFAAVPCKSQVNQQIQISSIPKKLTWLNSPLSYQVGDQHIKIIAGPKTDMFRDPNVTYNTDNAPKLLFEPDSNFVLTAKISHPFAQKWDGGALVLFNDDLNWIKFCFEKDYTGAKRVVTVVTKDVSDDCNSLAIAGNSVYFKMAKAGNVITMYCSTDGKKWLLIRHVQFNRSNSLKVGFLAQSPTGKKCEVSFSAIKYEARKIKDPYLGK